MSHIHRLVVAVTVGLAVSIAGAGMTARGAAQEFGSIVFPNSGTPAAQEPFLTGVKALHNFQFDEAAEAFQRAQRADPAFALAYWGEAMSHNHPLWAQQDGEKAKAVLDRLDSSAEGRLAKAKQPKEKAFMQALQTLYFSAGDKLARDQAYAAEMARMHAQWPDDHEVATFYALSLLGTVRPGDTGFRRQAQAAAIAQAVYAKNPQHPGAAHFIIHAFDDPDHAPLGLPAAEAYAKIAPSAAHALHMPSHIFVQLGMWEQAVTSNVAAYAAATALNTRLKLPEGREDFHTLSWLAYANTMLGRIDEAKKNVEQARAAMERNPDNAGIRDGYLGMRARLISDTGAWEKLTFDAGNMHCCDGGDHAAMPGMSNMTMPPGSATWTWIVGVNAAKLGDLATAREAETRLKALTAGVQSGPTSYAAKPHLVREKELGAVIRWAEGKKDEALQLAKEAAEVEQTMAAPSGPPEPIKPAFELYGELLLDAGRPREAAAAFEQALLRTPRRTPSMDGCRQAQGADGC